MSAYIAYGVGIESELAFDALPVCESEIERVHLVVRYATELPPRASDLTKLCQSQGRNIYVVVRPHSVLIRVGAFLVFEFWPGDRRIECLALSIVPDPLLRYWFLQQVLPMYLLWSGTAEFLHGMAIETVSESRQPRSVIGIMGESHAGKSTLLSYFLSRGHALISDDHLAIARSDYATILPATPYYRPYRAGEDLGHVASRFSPQAAPLHHLFLLEPALPYADVSAELLTGVAAVTSLLPLVQYNLHNPEVPQLFPLVEERFHGLNRLVRNVPIERLFVPRDLDRLPEVYDFIQKRVATPLL